jgi:hypothetical protein
VILELDTEPRDVDVPPALAAALNGDEEARAAFEKMAFTHLEQTGIPGSARILSVTDVSTDSEFPPEVDLLLGVTVPGRPTYRVARHDTVPRIAIGRLTDGRPLPVLVDPAQPEQLVIEWMAQPQR